MAAPVPAPVPVLSADGDVAAPDQWFSGAALPADPVAVVAVLGPQSSGKSTLANALFATAFPVAPRAAVAARTTRGIMAARPAPAVVVLDVEGADARERRREGRAFQARCAGFVTAVADVVILNIWFHDACRLDSAAYALLGTVLQTCAQACVEGSEARTALVLAIRDVEDETVGEGAEGLETLLRDDAAEMWADIAVEAGLPAGGTVLEDVIDLSVYMFPHIRHRADEFEEQAQVLSSAIDSGEIGSAECSKSIPADGFAVYASTLWDSISLTAPSGAAAGYADHGADADYYAGEDLAIVAAYRCDEVFSTLLGEASGDIGDLLDLVEAGTKVSGLGVKCHQIVTQTLQEYDVQTSDFADEPVYERKRRELEAIIDTGLMSVYMKNIAICARNALASFKGSIAEEVPVDYALYTADNEFVKEAKDGIRSGSAWTYDTERTDLQNMMTEIAAQQRKLLDTQLTASEQHSKAIQFLRMQHAQMQAVQQQAMGGGVGQWSLGAAYRPPDTNVNLSFSHNAGRSALQVSMVPDESSTMLGPTGFTSGVGIGNLGLSFNIGI